MVEPASGPHRGVLQRAQSGKRLASVADADTVARGVDAAARHRRDAGAMREQVQRNAFTGEDRPRGTAHATERRAGPARIAVSQVPGNGHCRVDLPEHLGRGRSTGEHAGFASDECGLGLAVGIDAGDGRDVAEQPEVLGERAGDERLQVWRRRIEIRHDEVSSA